MIIITVAMLARDIGFALQDPQGLSRQLQQCYESLVEGSDWRDTIERPLMHYMETESSAYWDASLRDLLRFMKNSSKHEDKVNWALRRDGSMQELLQHGAFRYAAKASQPTLIACVFVHC